MSFVSCNSFDLKCFLSVIRTATSALFWLLFAWNIVFHLVTFNLSVLSVLKFVSYRPHRVGSCFFIHSVDLCLLIGKFKPFTVKVIGNGEGLTNAILLFDCCMSCSFSVPHVFYYCLPLCFVDYF